MAAALLAGALVASPGHAASHRPLMAPKPALDGHCSAHPLRTAYVAGVGPTCCAGSMGCAEFLSTTTVVRPKAPNRS